jgi:hypothetical protein
MSECGKWLLRDGHYIVTEVVILRDVRRRFLVLLWVSSFRSRTGKMNPLISTGNGRQGPGLSSMAEVEPSVRSRTKCVGV